MERLRLQVANFFAASKLLSEFGYSPTDLFTRKPRLLNLFVLSIGTPALHSVDARYEMVFSSSRGDEEFLHIRIRRGNYFLRNPVHCILVTYTVGELQ